MKRRERGQRLLAYSERSGIASKENNTRSDFIKAAAPGYIAIMQARTFIAAMIVAFQLWLITAALHELLSAQPLKTIWLFGASSLCFIIALFIALRTK